MAESLSCLPVENDASQWDGPWRNVVTPEIEYGRKSSDLEGDQKSLVDED